MTVPTTKLFNALNGLELREIILKQVTKALDDDWHFRRNLTYPIVRFKFRLDIHAYPQDPPEFDVETEAAMSIDPEFQPEVVDGVPIGQEHIELAGGAKIEAPDKAREESGLPVPSPERAAGTVVERPIEPAKGLGKGPGLSYPTKQE